MDGPFVARIFCWLRQVVWSGHVFGLLTRFMTAGPDGYRGLGSLHCGALLRRDDVSEFPNPGPDHFAVASICSLRGLRSGVAAFPERVCRRVCVRVVSGGQGLRLWVGGLPVSLARDQHSPSDPRGLGRLREYGDLDRTPGQNAALPWCGAA